MEWHLGVIMVTMWMPITRGRFTLMGSGIMEPLFRHRWRRI